MNGLQIDAGAGLFELLDRIRSSNGLLVLILLGLVAFTCSLLSSLAWKVWRAAMDAKEREIRRLTRERDKYQAIVFDRLVVPQDVLLCAPPDWPEDEGGSGQNASLNRVH